VELGAGWHKVRLDFEAAGPNNALEWMWERPDGVTEVVPPYALRVGPEAGGQAADWPEVAGPVMCP
jgi:hypothetical protein